MIKSKHDIPDSIRIFIDSAIEYGLLEPSELYAAAAYHKENYTDMIEEIIQYAYDLRLRYEEILTNMEVHAAECERELNTGKQVIH